MLRRGDLVPHFEVKTLQGELFSYATVWQRKNLVLVTLPATEAGSPATYVPQLTAWIPEFTAHNAECVMTQDPVPGILSPGVIIADRWGEVVFVVATSAIADLPRPQELMDWLAYVQTQCPECEGEVK
jgi:hypothetical protein